MQAVNPQPNIQNPPPSQVACHLRQYWPAWIYKAALTGLAIGEYGLHKWQFTAGSAGIGLVAMYALSYFLRNEDVVINPSEVLQYQEINDQNIADLDVAERVVNDIEALATRQEELLEEGKSSILRNRAAASSENKGLTQLVAEAKQGTLQLQAAVSGAEKTGGQIDEILQAEGKDIQDLERQTLTLDQIVARGRRSLEQLKE